MRRERMRRTIEEERLATWHLDDDDEFSFPPFGKPTFGGSPLTSDSEFSHRPQHSSSSDSYRPSPSVTPNRPIQPKVSASVGAPPPAHNFGAEIERAEKRLGKHSNGSAASLVNPGSFPSGGFLASRKGSLASLKNAFKSSSQPIPPVPPLEKSAPGYPALRNPFSRFDTPASPVYRSPRPSVSGPSGKSSPTPHHGFGERKQSTASQRSQRSAGSSNFRAEDHPLPALPKIPSRPGTRNRAESASSVLRHGSIGGEEDDGYTGGLGTLGRSPAEEALRVVFRDFQESADRKISRILARPLIPPLTTYLSPSPIVESVMDGVSWTWSANGPRATVLVLEQRTFGLTCLQMRVEDAAAILNARKSLMDRDENQLPMRKAVSQLHVELLGQLSNSRWVQYLDTTDVRFLSVSDRFVVELNRCVTSGPPPKDIEVKVEHLLKGMKHLKLRVYPEEELELSAEFLHALSRHFANAHGQNLKAAYAETLTSLLHPVVESSDHEPETSLLGRSLPTGRYRAWCVSARDLHGSLARLYGFDTLQIQGEFRNPNETDVQDRNTNLRSIACNCFIRLLWVYLNRCAESSTSSRKRLDGVLRVFFPSSPGVLFPSDLPLEPFIIALHYVMAKQFDYGEEWAMEFLNEHQLSRGTDNRDVLYADRTTVTIRAILYTLRKMELEKPPTWPQYSDFTKFSVDGFESSGDELALEISARADIAEFFDKCTPIIIQIVFNCDRISSPLLLSSEGVSHSTHASSSWDSHTDNMTRKHGDTHVTYPSRHQPALRLLSSIFDSFPRCLAATNFLPVANALCRGTFSADPVLCEAACEAVKRISSEPSHCRTLVETYGQFIFESRHVFRDTFIGSRLLELQIERVTRLWSTLLDTFVNHQRLAAAAFRHDEGARWTPVESQMLEKIEGCGLFLLCSASFPLRRLAAPILAAARDLEGPQKRPSAAFRYSRISPEKAAVTRVLQIYDGAWDDSDIATIRRLPWFNASDRHRLDLILVKSKQIMQRVAESDHPKDGALWLSLLPFFLARLADQTPNPVIELRTTTIAVVLRLQAYISAIGNPRATPKRPPSDTATLADHWRSFLTVLCVTTPLQQQTATPPRKEPVLTTDTIGTAAGLFHYLTAVLAYEDTRFRDAAVHAMGSIRPSLLRPLSETLLGLVRRLADSSVGKRPPQAPLWTAVAHVFRLISPLILDARSTAHLANLTSMIGFVKVTQLFLSDPLFKEDYELQSLKRSFCHVVENLTSALGKLDSSERFLGEEMRGAIFKLCFDWCHVGRRPDVAKARESATLQAAAGNYRGDRDRAQYLDDLQAKTKLLSAAAAEAMAGLCVGLCLRYRTDIQQGRLISASESSPEQQASDHIVEPLTVRGSVRADNRRALFALIKFNHTCTRLLDEVLHQSFGEGEQFGLDSSFFGVVADIMMEGLVQLPIEQVACLALSKLGHPVADIRQRAFQLAETLLPGDKLEFATLLPAIGSSAANIYRQAQKRISATLASLYADHAIAIISECTSRTSQLDAPRRQATLSILPSWVAVLDLSSDTESREQIHQVLSNLMYLAIRFSDDHLEEIRELFVDFAGHSHRGNTTALVKFLFEQGGKRKSPDFVRHAQQVVACLAQSPAGDLIFEEISSFVEPSAMAALPESDAAPSPLGSVANLDSLVNASRAQTFSTGQLAMLFAGELLPNSVDLDLNDRLPTLLHAALIHCDHVSSMIREESQGILFQVLRAWICDVSNVPEEDASALWSTAEFKTTTLARSRSTAFWRAEDDGGPESAPAKMTTLVLKIQGILQHLQPRLRQQWGELALSWATSCPIRHLACRSFQVFRILLPRANPRMVSDILARLTNTIASPSPEVQAFNQEVLRTFASIVINLSPTEMMAYPQIFWCSVACLTTPFEAEFVQVVDLLSHVLDKSNLIDDAVVQHLLSFRPKDWVGPPPHLQSLLLVGLRSSKTVLTTFDLIRRLTSTPYDDLVDAPSDRLLHGFVAALPWMLHSTDLGEPNEDLACMALDLAALADSQNHASFSRLLTSFAKVRFRAKDDFIRQAASLLRDFMTTHALDIVTLLLGFVLNSEDWMREKSMQILKLVLQSPEARIPLNSHGDELLQPLLRLVSTKHASQALDVLDIPTMDAPAPSSSADIFGPIQESGWSIAKPKELSGITRENVNAVFNTCAIETRAASAHFSVVQFADMKPFGFNASQISLDLPSPTNDNASMGDLVGALYSLNQFFDDEGDMESISPVKTNSHARNGSGNVSERRVRAIMARATTRTPSISSPIYHSFQHHSHSISETSVSSDDLQHPSESDYNESTFGLDEFMSTDKMDMSDSNTSLLSEQSTPVMMRKTARFGFLGAGDDRTPSPRDF
ncbi:hypothetical protein P7C73_g153, partial [Tremellales sp. Uapishka_1]